MKRKLLTITALHAQVEIGTMRLDESVEIQDEAERNFIHSHVGIPACSDDLIGRLVSEMRKKG
ncbi:hypothetical protein ACPDHL_13695 [Myroides sp. C15-4]|uniref:hypothetical protein n=1 Tax=Myroides sp. C15-4 TaxID=3400532 RepID=UPI003D2F7DDD